MDFASYRREHRGTGAHKYARERPESSGRPAGGWRLSRSAASPFGRQSGRRVTSVVGHRSAPVDTVIKRGRAQTSASVSGHFSHSTRPAAFSAEAEEESALTGLEIGNVGLIIRSDSHADICGEEKSKAHGGTSELAVLAVRPAGRPRVAGGPPCSSSLALSSVKCPLDAFDGLLVPLERALPKYSEPLSIMPGILAPPPPRRRTRPEAAKGSLDGHHRHGRGRGGGRRWDPERNKMAAAATHGPVGRGTNRRGGRGLSRQSAVRSAAGGGSATADPSAIDANQSTRRSRSTQKKQHGDGKWQIEKPTRTVTK